MKIRWTPQGAEIDAVDLGGLLGLDPATVPAKMRQGEITSRSEEGIDEDAGKHRLTFWYKGRRVRIICDAQGNVLKTTRTNPPKS
ncbi:DUF6522 family protein [Yoonia litorea]|uniref:Uncharacterized protein n=1 Tax=Yoonia litorea TaxID=1123755 RepID=A0A1I6MVQ8_9RHOB|nr:DUF6522 family protein [Yoonia litorea]SFS19691.1 hypothetical protein SAMN05444714_2305 [Yoonia litorea]